MERGIVEKVPNIVIEPPGPNAKKIIEMDNEFVATSTKAPRSWSTVPPGR